MRKSIIVAAALFSLLTFVSCGSQESVAETGNDSIITTMADTADSESDTMNLITPEELISVCGLTEADYQGKDLNAFIADFALTKENVTNFNVAALLKNYTSVRNVEDILKKDTAVRESDFTKDVVAVAFLENKNTSVKSMYLDIAEKKAWTSETKYVFSDLNEVESKDVPDAADFASKMESLNIFSLTNQSSSEDIKDGTTFKIAVEYADGSVFRVTRSGIPSEIQPDNYDEIRKLMFFQS